MSLQRKKLSLLKSLKILIDCMSSTGLKKKVLVNWMPGSKKKKYPKLLVHLVQRKILFSGVQKTATKKMSEFTICFLFFKMWDENRNITWAISDNKTSFLYCFNNENIDLEQILDILNVAAVNCGLSSSSWKLPFHKQKSNAESWNL